MIIEVLKKLVNKQNLCNAEIKAVFEEILCKNASPVLVSAFLTALRMKNETIEEITAAVEFMREQGEFAPVKSKNAIDIVGTGGDGADTFNISTAAAFVIAAAGAKVAKHGNRSSSSKSGAADVLEALGANIMTNDVQNKEIFNETGICFMFAPKYSPILKNAASIRKELKIRTIFNLLGPIINPSGVDMQLIGVYDKNLIEPIIHVMKNLGIKNGMTLFGECGLDEASVVSKTYFAKITNGVITKGEFVPEDFNIKRAKISDIKGGNPIENSKIMQDIFQNKIQGAKKDVVALNAALGLVIAGKCPDVKEGLSLSYDTIENGKAMDKLNQFIEKTNEYIK